MVTFSGVDSTATDHIFIEPNEHRRWQIITRTVRLQGLIGSTEHEVVDDAPPVTSLGRIKPVKDEGGSYILLGKTDTGYVAMRL